MIDQDGFPGAMGDDGTFDGGDTAAILGTLYALGDSEIGLRFRPCFNYFFFGVPLRHPDRTKWYGQRDRFSRDQLIPLICAGVMNRWLTPINAIYEYHKDRYFLTAWNTRGNGSIQTPEKFPDITGPEVWALWLRYKRAWWAWPLLCILDLEMLAGAIHWRYWRKDNVCRNHMLVIICSNEVLPTPFSWLSDKITRWNDLIERWQEHCRLTYEYPTFELFKTWRGK